MTQESKNSAMRRRLWECYWHVKQRTIFQVDVNVHVPLPRHNMLKLISLVLYLFLSTLKMILLRRNYTRTVGMGSTIMR